MDNNPDYDLVSGLDSGLVIGLDSGLDHGLENCLVVAWKMA